MRSSNWLIKAVRSATNWSLDLWSVRMSSCSCVFNSTKRMVGCIAASPSRGGEIDEPGFTIASFEDPV
jgi:hypothetical protein